MGFDVEKVIQIAESEVGYLEKRNNSNLYDKTANAGSANYTKYGKEMHDIYQKVMDYPAAWCDAFVDWCFYKAYGVANAKGLLGGNFDDYTPNSAGLYKNKGAYIKRGKGLPRRGDQIFFTNGTRIYHTGLVYAVDSSKVYTIEGNTSGGSKVVANGGGVFKKSYSLNNSKIDGYGRPKYDVVNNQIYSALDFRNEIYAILGGGIERTITISTRVNNRNKCVAPIQRYLNSMGFNCGAVDCDYGTKTAEAIRKYQRDIVKAQLQNQDGIISAKGATWRHLLSS